MQRGMGDRLFPVCVTSGVRGRIVDPKYVWVMDRLPMWGTRDHVTDTQRVGNRWVFRVWGMASQG